MHVTLIRGALTELTYISVQLVAVLHVVYYVKYYLEQYCTQCCHLFVG